MRAPRHAEPSHATHAQSSLGNTDSAMPHNEAPTGIASIMGIMEMPVCDAVSPFASWKKMGRYT